MSKERPHEIHDAIECLQRLSNAFGERREQLAESVGLTEHQWGVLEEISTEHFMPSMFARQRESTAAAVSKTIRQLVDKGLVEVSLSKADARQRDYQLTEQGRQVMAALREARATAIREVWEKLDANDVRQFTVFGNQLAQALTEHGKRASRKRDDHGNDAVRKGF